MKHNLFVYGSLMNPEVVTNLLGSPRKYIGSCRLSGYTKENITIEGQVYPIAVEYILGEIHGHILEVTNEDLEKLDEYEGPNYQRIETKLDNLQCYVYVKREAETSP